MFSIKTAIVGVSSNYRRQANWVAKDLRGTPRVLLYSLHIMAKHRFCTLYPWKTPDSEWNKHKIDFISCLTCYVVKLCYNSLNSHSPFNSWSLTFAKPINRLSGLPKRSSKKFVLRKAFSKGTTKPTSPAGHPAGQRTDPGSRPIFALTVLH
jgi:hypothetical protein